MVTHQTGELKVGASHLSVDAKSARRAEHTVPALLLRHCCRMRSTCKAKLGIIAAAFDLRALPWKIFFCYFLQHAVQTQAVNAKMTRAKGPQLLPVPRCIQKAELRRDAGL